MIKDGHEFRWGRDHSVTIRGNKWFQHNGRFGGCAIDFLKEFHGMNFAEAVQTLLEGCKNGKLKFSVQDKEQETPVPFCLPKRHTDMRRLYAYLVKSRCIDADVISVFVREGTMYEDDLHNIIFCARNETGDIVNAQKKSTYSYGRSYRGTVAGSNMDYSFCHIGTDDAVYVFEAPIDMLAYITLHQEKWMQHSYIALGGGNEHPLLHMLDTYDHLETVYLCTDHDIGGIEIAERLNDVLADKSCNVVRILPENKDIDEDLKKIYGLEVEQAVKHPGEQYLKSLPNEVTNKTGTFKDIIESYATALYSQINDVVFENELKLMIGYSLGHLDITIEDICAQFRLYRSHQNVEAHQKALQKVINKMKHQHYVEGVIEKETYAELIKECIGTLISIQMEAHVEQKHEIARAEQQYG